MLKRANLFSHCLRIVVVGNVDHGKSTLIGRLLHDTGSLPEKKKEQLEALSLAEGRDFEFAFLLDSLKEEQAENITIDTTQIFFPTPERDYVIIDAPGHREFLKNMLTGAASANAALLVIDVHEGIQEQTERHLQVLNLIGLEHVIVVINKMDCAQFSEKIFQQAIVKVERLLKKFSFDSQTTIIPVAAKLGLNITRRAKEMSWYQGPTLIEALHDLPQATSLEKKPLRLMIQDIYHDQKLPLLVGRIESGKIEVGEDVIVWPIGKKEKVSSLELWNARTPPTKAIAGESIAMTLKDSSLIERGCVITHLHDFPQCLKKIEIHLFWLCQQPLALGDQVTLKLGTQSVKASLVSLNKMRGISVEESDKKLVIEHEFAEAFFQLEQPIICDRYEEIEPMGRVTIFLKKQIVGAGIILK